jgi:hypothetical protein
VGVSGVPRFSKSTALDIPFIPDKYFWGSIINSQIEHENGAVRALLNDSTEFY